VSGSIGDTGALVGVFVLVDDDPVWQATMRRQLNESVATTPPEADRG
jgi:hypothetical protein